MRLGTCGAMLIVVGGFVGCGHRNNTLEPGATTAASDLDPVTARRFINDVRLGQGLDDEGKVPKKLATSSFAVGDSIHLSTEVADAPAGSVVRVSVHDATDGSVWSDEKRVVPGRSYLSYTIDRGLAQGKYRADVVIGDEVVARRPLEVFARKE